MKYLIISDIHGDFEALKEVLGRELNKVDLIICLGDLFSYNKSDNEGIINLFKFLKEKLVLIKGNCDLGYNFSREDLTSYYAYEINSEVGLIFAAHGDHYYDPTKYDIYLSGHTHNPLIKKSDKTLFINPGSVGRPRGESPASYAILTERGVYIYSVMGEKVCEFCFN